MLRIDRVEQYVRNWCGEHPGEGITATEAAQALELWRSDASSFLNQLEKAGILRRSQTRPVRFFLCCGEEEGPERQSAAAPAAFPNIIGSGGSLRLQSQLALAAAVYPPTGIHTLIIGETGVGKSLMAEEIWRSILHRRHTTEKETPFVVFNCAEYAENPQLLLSQLFGYEKGAFTGADRTRDGLIEQARNGVLFLDEMHRLPATGQEMFFTVIDKGVYRRLGGSTEQPLRLMIIGATTENPSSSFLTTFRRRFPMLIQIPNLSERPIRERVQLVNLFLTQEAKRLALPIRLSRDALKRMAAYQGEGNIGELKNMIQICCAKSYERSLGRGRLSQINIMVEDLPRRMLSAYHEQEDIEQYFSSVFLDDSVTLFPNEAAGGGMALPPAEKGTAPYTAGRPFSSDMPEDARRAFFGTVSTNVWNLTQDILRRARHELKREYPREAYLSVAFFLQQTQLYARAGSVFHAENPLPFRPSGAELAFVQTIRPQIFECLGIQMMERESDALALLFSRYLPRETPRIRLIIVSHGDTIASGMAGLTNELLNTDLVVGIDMPINVSNSQTVKRLCSLVRSSPAAEGLVLLAESTALSAYRRDILQETQCDVRIIPFVNSILALELCKGILTTEQSMDAIISNATREFQQYTARMLQDGEDGGAAALSTRQSGKSVVITLCTTGIGSAKLAQEYLLNIPSIAECAEVLSLSMSDDLETITRSLGKRLRLIVGFLDPQITGIPFVGIENLFTQSGVNRISILLHQWPVEERETPTEFKGLSLERQLAIVSGKMDRFAPSFDAEAISAEVLHVIQRVCVDFQDMEADRVVRLYIHTAAMFERLHSAKENLLRLDGLPEQAGAVLAVHRAYYDRLKKLLGESCRRLELPLSEAEVYYLMLSLPRFDHI